MAGGNVSNMFAFVLVLNRQQKGSSCPLIGWNVFDFSSATDEMILKNLSEICGLRPCRVYVLFWPNGQHVIWLHLEYIFTSLQAINEFSPFTTHWGYGGRILDLRRDHTLSSDLPLMRFFFISPQQKISSLHTGNETDSEFEQNREITKGYSRWKVE